MPVRDLVDLFDNLLLDTVRSPWPFRMSYGAPWDQGVGVSDTTPLLDLEAPGLVPDADGNGLKAKPTRRHRYQRGRQQQRRAEKSSREEQSRVDQDCCFGVIAEAVDMNRRELSAISRGLDLLRRHVWSRGPMLGVCARHLSW